MSDCVVNGCIPRCFVEFGEPPVSGCPPECRFGEDIQSWPPGENFSGNLLSGCEIDDWLVGRREVTSVQ